MARSRGTQLEAVVLARVVVAEAEHAGDDLDAQRARRLEACGPGLGLDAPRDVGQAGGADEGALELAHADKPIGAVGRAVDARHGRHRPGEGAAP